MSNSRQCKVIIIEPSPVVRQGLKMLLEEYHEFVVQDMYCDFQAFQTSRLNHNPDVILMNPSVVSFYKQFAVSSLFENYGQTIFVAILYKYINTEVLNGFDGILDIYDESPVMLKKLQETVKAKHGKKDAKHDDDADLSEREKEILASVAKGLTNKEIADKHHISVHTVVSHRKNITRKTGIKTVSGLTVYAMFNSLISPTDLQ